MKSWFSSYGIYLPALYAWSLIGYPQLIHRSSLGMGFTVEMPRNLSIERETCSLSDSRLNLGSVTGFVLLEIQFLLMLTRSGILNQWWAYRISSQGSTAFLFSFHSFSVSFKELFFLYFPNSIFQGVIHQILLFSSYVYLILFSYQPLTFLCHSYFLSLAVSFSVIFYGLSLSYFMSFPIPWRS